MRSCANRPSAAAAGVIQGVPWRAAQVLAYPETRCFRSQSSWPARFAPARQAATTHRRLCSRRGSSGPYQGSEASQPACTHPATEVDRSWDTSRKKEGPHSRKKMSGHGRPIHSSVPGLSAPAKVGMSSSAPPGGAAESWPDPLQTGGGVPRKVPGIASLLQLKCPPAHAPRELIPEQVGPGRRELHRRRTLPQPLAQRKGAPTTSAESCDDAAARPLRRL